MGDAPNRSTASHVDREQGAAPTAPAAAHYLDWSARGRSSSVRYLVGLVLILLGWAAGTVTVHAALTTLGRTDPDTAPGHLAYVTATFAVGLLCVPAVARAVLARPGWSVVAGAWPGPVRQAAVGAAISAVAALAVDLLITPVAPLERIDWVPSTWLLLSATALFGFLIQVGFEELLFRGFLMQAVASRTARTTLVIGLPALLFALPHWGNLTVYGNQPLQLAPYLLMGLTYGWAAWFSGSLWLPLGMHWANNSYATILITSTGDVLPSGAPLARDLSSVSLTFLIGTTTLNSALQVIAIKTLVPQVRREVRLGIGHRADRRAHSQCQ